MPRHTQLPRHVYHILTEPPQVNQTPNLGREIQAQITYSPKSSQHTGTDAQMSTSCPYPTLDRQRLS